MDNSPAQTKEHKSPEMPGKKTDAVVECETICREILKCIHEPVTQNKVDVKPKKERELLEGVTEYLIFWN